MVDEQQDPNAPRPNPWAAPGSYDGPAYGLGAAPARRSRQRRSRQRRSPLVVAAAMFTVGAIGVSPLIYNSLRSNPTTTSSTQTWQGEGVTPNGDVPGRGAPDGGSTGGDSSGGQWQGRGWPGRDSGSDSGADAGSSSVTGRSTATRASANLSRGVVLIDTEVSGGQGAGTGMILTSDGQVLTSYHVVNGSTSIKVTVAATGRTYTAEVVGHDQARDIALLKLKDANGLTPITVDQDAVNPGTNITAVGNASGQGYLTQVQGTITALNQAITASSDDGAPAEKLTGLLQTTAGVVPGDSGGPMYDAQGEVLGINAAASAANQNSDQTGAPTQSFAVPISTAMSVVDQIRSGNESGTVLIGRRAFLGISMSPSSNGTGGVTLAEVTDGGAATKAGMVAGDTITSVDGVRTSTSAALSGVIAKHNPGDSVRVTWLTSSGAIEHATITLGQSPLN